MALGQAWRRVRRGAGSSAAAGWAWRRVGFQSRKGCLMPAPMVRGPQYGEALGGAGRLMPAPVARGRGVAAWGSTRGGTGAGGRQRRAGLWAAAREPQVGRAAPPPRSRGPDHGGSPGKLTGMGAGPWRLLAREGRGLGSASNIAGAGSCRPRSRERGSVGQHARRGLSHVVPGRERVAGRASFHVCGGGLMPAPAYRIKRGAPLWAPPSLVLSYVTFLGCSEWSKYA